MSGSQTIPRLPPAYRLVHLESCGSTNSEAMRLARSGDEPLPLWVLADRQTAGRGRSGRVWQSLPGNLLASLALPLGCPPHTVAELSLVAGNAVCDAVRAARPGIANLRLKWPNDLLVGGAKLGGILVESAALPYAAPPGQGTGQAGALAVVGIGLNLAAHPTDVDRPTSHLAAPEAPDPAAPRLVPPHLVPPHRVPSGLDEQSADGPSDLTPLDMLGYVGVAMHHWLAIWNEGVGLDQVLAGWLERAGPLGEPLAVNTGTRTVSGAFAGLDRTGALLLRNNDGLVERFTFGDVTLG